MDKKELWLIATVVLCVSAVGNGLFNGSFSHVATTALSILGSIALAVTIVMYAKKEK